MNNEISNDKQKKNFLKNAYEVFRKLPVITKVLTIISAVLVLFSFIAPALFIGEPLFDLDFTETGQIGDTIGGIMNPFISIAAVIVTFLAFYIQYQANETQKQALREQNEDFKNQIRQQEIDSQKTKFEKQFYEMLRLHKENLNDIIIIQNLLKHFDRNDGITEKTIIDKEIKGRHALTYLLFELELCLNIADKELINHNKKEKVHKAYTVFFSGYSRGLMDYNLGYEKASDEANFYNKISLIKSEYDVPTNKQLEKILSQEGISMSRYLSPNYHLFRGNSNMLAHYYRHLFHTIKFVVYQDIDVLNYEDKRNYLRILRAQMSNEEQTLLFYNWYSDFGMQWENAENKFFTDYRMIHNIYNSLLVPWLDLNDIFPNYKKSILNEKNRNNDHLFEYEDWI